MWLACHFCQTTIAIFTRFIFKQRIDQFVLVIFHMKISISDPIDISLIDGEPFSTYHSYWLMLFDWWAKWLVNSCSKVTRNYTIYKSIIFIRQLNAKARYLGVVVVFALINLQCDQSKLDACDAFLCETYFKAYWAIYWITHRLHVILHHIHSIGTGYTAQLIRNLVPMNSAFAAVWSFNTVVSNDFEMIFESTSSVLKSVLTVGLSKLRCSRVIFCFKSKVCDKLWLWNIDDNKRFINDHRIIANKNSQIPNLPLLKFRERYICLQAII